MESCIATVIHPLRGCLNSAYGDDLMSDIKELTQKATKGYMVATSVAETQFHVPSPGISHPSKR